MALPCPSCGAAMVSPPEFGEAVSGCRTCCGLWLSNEASVAVAQGKLHPEVVALAARVDAHLPELAEGEGYRRQAAVSGRRCPQCEHPLSPVVISRQRIELDVCAAHGTWFDRNELRTVLTALAIEHQEHLQAREQQGLIDGEESQQVQTLFAPRPTRGGAALTQDVVRWLLDRS